MLARMQSLFGPFPASLLEGREARKYLTPGGTVFARERDLHHGGGADAGAGGSDSERESHLTPPHGASHTGGTTQAAWPAGPDDPTRFVVLAPMRTNLRLRLGRVCDGEKPEDVTLFLEFLTALLSVDPDTRPTAAQALQHPWLAADLPMEPYVLPQPAEGR